MNQGQPIALECSSTLVIIDFLETCINLILTQRGIYNEFECRTKVHYDLSIPIIEEPEVVEYLGDLLCQVERWIMYNTVQRLILVIKSKRTMEEVERWYFNIKRTTDVENANDELTSKQIKTILRQIQSSISFLPEITDKCTFNVLACVDKKAEAPHSWRDADPKTSRDSKENLQLSAFQTDSHKVNTSVEYLADI